MNTLIAVPSHLTLNNTVLPDDSERIRCLVQKTRVFRECEVAIACELIEQALTHPQSGYHFIFARDERDQLVGYSCYGVIPLTDNRFDLYWIVVDPELQRHQVGSRLFAETERAVAMLSGKQLYAETSSTTDYRPAQRFYLRHGFQEVARLKDFYRDGDDKIIYCKNY